MKTKRIKDISELDSIDLSEMTRKFDIKSFYLESEDIIATIIITQNQVIIVCAESNLEHPKIYDKILELIERLNDNVPSIMIHCRNDMFVPWVNNKKCITNKQNEIVIAFYNQLLQIKENVELDFDELKSIMDDFKANLPNNIDSRPLQIKKEKIIGIPIDEYRMKASSENER
ncbi:MAG TPA: hypothetical protein DEP51_02540 [Clostridiales bacterium]|nr:hypothetical protein [Clostridiales bacterium]